MESATKRRRIDVTYREFEDGEESGYESTGDEWRLSGGEAQESSEEWTDSDSDVNPSNVGMGGKRMGSDGKAVLRWRKRGGNGGTGGMAEKDGAGKEVLKASKPKRKTNILEVRGRPYCCYWGCGAKFRTIDETNKHVLETHTDTPLVKYRCPHPECGLVFPHPRFIFDHYKTHTEVPREGFQLVDIGDVNELPDDRWTYTQHKKERKGCRRGRRTKEGEGYPCMVPGCGSWFQVLDSRGRHMRTAHAMETSEAEVKLECKHEGCGKSFNRLDNLRRHLRREHGDEIPNTRRARPSSDEKIVCGVDGCELEYTTIAALYTHRSRKHRRWRKNDESTESEGEESGGAERGFSCSADGCGLVFRTLHSMRVHEVRAHREEARFKCPEEGCWERFEFRCELNKHKTVSHPPPKPAAWEGDWPIKCNGPNCDAVFVRFARWKTHVQSHHPDLPVPDTPHYSRKRRAYVWQESESEISDGDQSNGHKEEINQLEGEISDGGQSDGSKEVTNQWDGEITDDEISGNGGNDEPTEAFIPSPFYRGPVPRSRSPHVKNGCRKRMVFETEERNELGRTGTEMEGSFLSSPRPFTPHTCRMSARLASARKYEDVGVNSVIDEIGEKHVESESAHETVETPDVGTPALQRSVRDRNSQSEKIVHSKTQTPVFTPKQHVSSSFSAVKLASAPLLGSESASKYVLNRQVVFCGVNGCRLQFTTEHSLEFHRKVWH